MRRLCTQGVQEEHDFKHAALRSGIKLRKGKLVHLTSPRPAAGLPQTSRHGEGLPERDADNASLPRPTTVAACQGDAERQAPQGGKPIAIITSSTFFL